MDSVLTQPFRSLLVCAIAVAASGRAEIAWGDDYRIDPVASELHILVYRAGPLRRLGHNHVVAARDLTGRVTRGSALEGSTVEISVPVDRLTVDDATLRTRYGEDFASMPSDADVEDTAANMGGENVLDAANHPQIEIEGVLHDSSTGYRVDVDIDVKNTVWHDTIPIDLEVADDMLVARGRVEISQEALGLEPFSIMLGALRVADVIDVRFSLVAKREMRD